MSNPIVTEVNCATGEVIEREMTNEEYSNYLASLATEEVPPTE